MDHFIKECAHLFHDRQSRGHLSLSFYIQFFEQSINIVLQCALAFVIERKITLASDAYSRPFMTIRSHDLYTDEIRGCG
jgi:hypothetical protein